MKSAVTRGYLVAAGCLLVALGCVSEPVSAACAVRDLGPFSMCVPVDWQLKKGGIDSAAGTLNFDKLSVSYDFGLYSEPLSIPPGTTEVSSTAVVIDGLSGRSVVYLKQTLHFAGLHLPAVRLTSMGMMKLTIVAQSFSKAELEWAETAFQSIRIGR